MGYSNWDVAHRWMSGQGTRCTGSNMFFEGDEIFSYGYHFVIARKWNGVILLNDDTYSSSTAKHQSYVRAAIWGKVVHCAVLDHRTDPESDWFYEKNMVQWQRQVEYIVNNQLARARKPEKYLNEILAIVDKAKALCEVIGRKLPKELKIYEENLGRDEVIKRVQEDAKRRIREAECRRREREKKALAKFLTGETNYAPSKYQICRLNTETNRFETSLGVEIPFEIGRRFYEALKNGEVKVGDRLLYYTVASLGKDIQIGCHRFKRKYLMEFGDKVFNN